MLNMLKLLCNNCPGRFRRHKEYPRELIKSFVVINCKCYIIKEGVIFPRNTNIEGFLEKWPFRSVFVVQ